MVAKPAPDIVEREIRIAARPAKVFPFLIDADLLTRWMGRQARLDPRPGGIFLVDLNGEMVAAGIFLEVDPPRRVAFTFGWEQEDQLVRAGASTVEITLTPDGDGTMVRLIHRDLPAEERESHGADWSYFLPRLEAAALGPNPDATSAT